MTGVRRACQPGLKRRHVCIRMRKRGIPLRVPGYRCPGLPGVGRFWCLGGGRVGVLCREVVLVSVVCPPFGLAPRIRLGLVTVEAGTPQCVPIRAWAV